MGVSLIFVVSGLPRSGTSMMMRMLEAGGLEVLKDGVRKADKDNPNGYFELESVKRLRQAEYDWLDGAKGKAVKIVAPLVPHLPDTYLYRILFMQRNIQEILASQQRMLARRGEAASTSDQEMGALFLDHIAKLRRWIDGQINMELLEVSYNHLLDSPEAGLRHVKAFVDRDLDVKRMAQVIDRSLYRNRQEKTSE